MIGKMHILLVADSVCVRVCVYVFKQAHTPVYTCVHLAWAGSWVSCNGQDYKGEKNNPDLLPFLQMRTVYLGEDG